MKKIALVFLLALLCLGILQAPAAAADIKLYINGAEKVADPAPFIDSQSGRTFVPIRFIAESFGAEVSWLEAEKKVVIQQSQNGKTINLYLNNKQASVNGTVTTLDAEPRIVNGRTVIPLRFVAENLDLDVTWDAATMTISINSKSTAIEPIFMPDGTKISINLLDGWKYTKPDPSTGFLFILTHSSGAIHAVFIEELPEKMDRDVYIDLVKENMENFDMEELEEEDLEDAYDLSYMLFTEDGDYYVFKRLLFPQMDDDYIIEDYVEIYSVVIPDALSKEDGNKIFDDLDRMVVFE